MSEYSYLDILPTERIADKLDKEIHSPGSVAKIAAELEAYVQIMEEENLRFLARPQDSKSDTMDSKDTLKFLRCQERTRNTRTILQYLKAFLAHLPLEENIAGKPVNPFNQMKAFVLFNIDLLKEKDVSASILQEHERLGLLNDTNSWYYRGQIDKSHRSLREIADSTDKATVENWCKIFTGLQQLCTFWFSVRNQVLNRVRKSDIFMYKMCGILIAKYLPKEEIILNAER